jgi:hypothetical protein
LIYLKKTKLLKSETIYQENTPFKFSYKDDLLHDETNIRFLALKTVKFMNWKTYVKFMLHKLGNASFAKRNMKCGGKHLRSDTMHISTQL